MGSEYATLQAIRLGMSLVRPVIGMGEMRNLYKILAGELQWKIPLGRLLQNTGPLVNCCEHDSEPLVSLKVIYL
jgi:hypothetical protein